MTTFFTNKEGYEVFHERFFNYVKFIRKSFNIL